MIPIATLDGVRRVNFEEARDFLASVGAVYKENYLDEDGEMDVSLFQDM